MTAQQLSASIKLTNNDYIFAPTTAEVLCAKRHPELFTIRGTLITHKGFTRPAYR